MSMRQRFLITATAVLAVAVASAATIVNAEAAAVAAPAAPIGAGPAIVTKISFDGAGAAAGEACDVWRWAPYINQNYKVVGAAQIICPQVNQQLSVEIWISMGGLNVVDSQNFNANSGSSEISVVSREVTCYAGDYQTHIIAYGKRLDGTDRTKQYSSEVATLSCPSPPIS